MGAVGCPWKLFTVAQAEAGGLRGQTVDLSVLTLPSFFFFITESEDCLMVQNPLFWTVSNSTISSTETDRCSDIS